jgi:hypothetical protein
MLSSACITQASWNFIVERRLPGDMVASAGYVGTQCSLFFAGGTELEEYKRVRSRPTRALIARPANRSELGLGIESTFGGGVETVRRYQPSGIQRRLLIFFECHN